MSRRGRNCRVFISHSHRDRADALKLQRVLKKNSVDTYLDQDKIQAGDILPERILEGIKWCDTFLLLWSWNAKQSQWVNREWELAYDQRKKILPYLLVVAPLPDPLQNLVFVNRGDQEHGHAQLLKALLGREYVPSGPTPFPGKWLAQVDVYGVIGGSYEIELRTNGQIVGYGNIGGGIFGPLMGPQGQLTIPVTGSWSYDEGTQLLTLEMTAAGLGQVQQDTVRIHATGHEAGAIQGQDFGGRIWILQRLAESPATMQANGTILLVDDDEYVLCEICGARVKEVNLDHHMRKVHSDE